MSRESRPTTPPNPNLLTYLLNYTPPLIPVQQEMLDRQPSSTLNDDEYAFDDLDALPPPWTTFNLDSIISQFQGELHSPLPGPLLDTFMSPPSAIRTEMQLHECAWRSVYTQLRRALRTVHLQPGYTRISDMHGEGIKNGSKADRIAATSDGIVRLVADLKPSWNFQSSWRDAEVESKKEEVYRQVLSQVVCYMNQRGVRYGYVLTDREFVAVRRAGRRYGDIEVAKGVAWVHGEGELSVALGLFGLHMLAARNDEWELPGIERPPRETSSERTQSSMDEDGMEMDSSFSLGSSEGLDSSF